MNADLQCPGCHYPTPADWCWDNRMNCPLRYMPRHLNAQDVLRRLWALEARVKLLEGNNDG